MTSETPAVRQRRLDLGKRLGEIRRDARLTARELASRAGWHESKCSNIQSGRRLPSSDDIRAWTAVCGVPEQADDLIAAAHGIEGMYVEWRRAARNGARHIQYTAVPLFKGTRHFRIYEPGVIPGLLQTRAYAGAILSTSVRRLDSGADVEAEIEAAVEGRLQRQEVLYDGGGRRFAFLIEESALRSRVADDETMAAQYGHLLRVAELPHVSLGVIPSGVRRAVWPVEGFWIFDQARVVVETVTAEITITQPSEVRQYARTFAQLGQLAVHGAALRSLVTTAIDSLG
ncbi:helix-turn-helix transcriptional regulator [Kitasatospora sp. NBC_01250]|uniref:helix-turn-helix domain-containing protein n=1 Tax=unclassified Kitasatospora TaxID=2633591 RepID=UPI002E161004|nr:MULTISPECIES: helix-turn-helix transcriptional regulator [unclassified Kitasatospora]WSJ68389.1 helix-turn-helix transcriptional regulator [Kitasatospora sp. NBC_01302]